VKGKVQKKVPLKIVKKVQRKAEIKKVFDPVSQATAEREIKKGMAALDEKIDDRYEFAQRVIEAQSPQVQQAIDDLVEEMSKMADNPPVFYYRGVKVHAADPEVAERMRTKNFYWLAVRMFVACAQWDMRIGDFKAPEGECGKCGKEV